ncbi:hydroxymethylbilane synthase [Caenibacillus caldisaponilyticus]|uniref:hydroxymethylbilane synthase n=1 Tax=Caenibacillus caldisaponilyticus TaxID=1674942 RepID=UPI000988521A|nr:hydroxymethylbilane synthase [Caenibacillus caldisaponilyticus]
MKTWKVGSRKSRLALTQTHWVLEQLKKRHRDFSYELKHIVTKGDQILDVALAKVGGKGLFVKEIEQALLDGEIDLAVHSMKDMPAQLPEGLAIVCVPRREDHRDVLISRDGKGFYDLPPGAVVGTSSLRRRAMLLHARPDLHVVSLRGNIDTRLKKLEEGQYDAIVLAAAGLNRMGWSAEKVTEYLPVERFLPAVGQGALAIECRADDEELIACLAAIHDPETANAVAAERAFLAALDGDCRVPIAAYAEKTEDGYRLTGMVAAPDGQTVINDSLTGAEPDALGWTLADRLKARGASELLTAAKEAWSAHE